MFDQPPPRVAQKKGGGSLSARKGCLDRRAKTQEEKRLFLNPPGDRQVGLLLQCAFVGEKVRDHYSIPYTAYICVYIPKLGVVLTLLSSSGVRMQNESRHHPGVSSLRIQACPSIR